MSRLVLNVSYNELSMVNVYVPFDTFSMVYKPFESVVAVFPFNVTLAPEMGLHKIPVTIPVTVESCGGGGAVT